MRAAWHLAISTLRTRRLRSALLAAAVAFSCALITAIACASASVSGSLTEQVGSALGSADVRLRDIGGQRFDMSMVDVVASWEGVGIVVPRGEGPVPLLGADGRTTKTAYGKGIVPELEYAMRSLPLGRGKPVRDDDDVVLDPMLAEQLGVDVGDRVRVAIFGEPLELEVVGITRPKPFEVQFARLEAWVTMETLGRMTPGRDRPIRVDMTLEDGVDASSFAATHLEELDDNFVLEPTERITSGLGSTVRANQIGMLIWSVLSLIASACIILTGLTTSVAERQRELAIVRCLGGTRASIAQAQLLLGGILGARGALVGIPLGVALAWVASIVFAEHLPTGLAIPPWWLVGALLGGIACGVLGASWPAWLASRTTPMQAVRSRSRAPSRASVLAIGVIGLVCVLVQPALMLSTDDSQFAYWSYVTVGAPLMFIGYFLLGVPTVVVVSRVIAPVLAWGLRVPRTLLRESLNAHPVRHGLTSGSLMAGLGLMVVIWTNGSSLLNDWIGAIRFPDAFVHGFRGLDDESREEIASLPFVEDTCAVTIQRLDGDAFGVRAIRALKTMYIGFEVEPFFRMTKVDWIQGDPETARARLLAGGAILVAREFMVAHELGVGDEFPITHNGVTTPFEIVGVIASPGLDLVSKYFDIGQEYRDQSLHAVFGSRSDLRSIFKNDTVHFIQMDLNDAVDDEVALAEIRSRLTGTLLSAGSGREIKRSIDSIGRSTLQVISSIALLAMVLSCFGVGNVVIASIEARQFELGVLRAIGSTGSMLARLITAEVLLIALSAGVLGSLMGLQAALAGNGLYRMLVGLDLSFSPPALPVALGWVMMIGLALLAGTPAAVVVARRHPRRLLATPTG
ncbi:MAG: FtsX-like permease family protein [Phycisphaerales bacterium JB043]